jgi:hypothetical protein
VEEAVFEMDAEVVHEEVEEEAETEEAGRYQEIFKFH